MIANHDQIVRKAMGLPDHFQDSMVCNISNEMDEVRYDSIRDLVLSLTSIDRSTKLRYAAGKYLALLGDPRIDIYQPDMITINAATAVIGTDCSSIDDIISQLYDTFVIRDWLIKETPQFSVSLSSYKIARYCVTNMEYRAFLLDTQYSSLPSSWAFGRYPHERANHPVYTVSPEAADAYVKWLSQKTGRRFRLPTEYEWEYAASGSSHLMYPWGDNYQVDCANTLEENILTSTPVGMFPKGCSPFGLADMGGNVEEYVSDYYAAYPGGWHIEDDLAKQGQYRVTRGGCFSRYRDLARTSRRHGCVDEPIYSIGFRLAESLNVSSSNLSY